MIETTLEEALDESGIIYQVGDEIEYSNGKGGIVQAIILSVTLRDWEGKTLWWVRDGLKYTNEVVSTFADITTGTGMGNCRVFESFEDLDATLKPIMDAGMKVDIDVYYFDDLHPNRRQFDGTVYLTYGRFSKWCLDDSVIYLPTINDA